MENKTTKILLGHGSGGRMTHELIAAVFKKRFSNPVLNSLDDAAVLTPKPGRLAFTTDSFVVNPIFFPGGDIGKLAVFGTVNDLAMKGAKPFAISVAAIIEEGLDISVLEKITDSVAAAARQAGVLVATGDTKVVERGKADKIFLTTSGVGIVEKNINISGAGARPGDSVLINGTLGDHGIAVLSARNDFKLRSGIKSDCAALNHLVLKLLSKCRDTHVLRDPTRGGLATTLNEIASSSGVGIILDEKDIPVNGAIKAACAILGLDPLYVANEGKFTAILPAKDAAKAIAVMRADKLGRASRIIGKVVKSPKGVWLNTVSGGLRPIVMLEG